MRRTLRGNRDALSILHDLERDEEVQTLISRGNDIVVNRLNYNDHGRVHSLISALNSLKVLAYLHDAGVEANIISEAGLDHADAQAVVLVSAYLHDVGDAISRDMHYFHGVTLASEPVRRILAGYRSGPKAHLMRAAILECIHTHDEHVPCTSIEAGCVTVGDGADMSYGRARIPYTRGKSDIHALSALAIERVRISRGKRRPVRISVEMTNPAGVFQIEKVLGGKIRSSGPIREHITVVGLIKGKEKRFTF